MKRYNRFETMDKGYDSGVTLAIWFPKLPDIIPVPFLCSDYPAEYRESLQKGFTDQRRKLENVERREL